VGLGALAYFYRQRLRTHLWQEVFAGAGIAVGVALVFAVVVANTSIGASARQISQGIAGEATLQLNARGDRGFPASVWDSVRQIPSVEQSAGVFEHRVILVGTHGRRSVSLVGVDLNLMGMGGSLTRNFVAGYGLSFGTGLFVPETVAKNVGIAPERTKTPGPPQRNVEVRLRGQTHRVPVAGVLGPDLVGGLSQAGVVVGMLPYVQELAGATGPPTRTGVTGRLTRILVKPRPGQEMPARRALAAIAGDRISVTSTDYESHVLSQAAGPNDQSTSLFAAISAVVGFLLAFNAMLLTAPERRRGVAELRKHGYTPGQLAQMVVFDAAMLGVIASAVGVLLGVVLAGTLFGGVPTYLSFAFPLGTQQSFGIATVLVAFVGGIVATVLAAAQPLLDLRPSRPADAVDFEDGEPGQAVSAPVRKRALVVAGTLALVATAIVILVPAATVAAVAALAIATMLALPAVLAGVVRLAAHVSRSRPSLNMLTVAAMALQSARLRSVALAATGAVAVFGSVSIEGAHHDLEQGLHASFSEYLHTSDLWVTTGGDDLTTESFPVRDTAARIRSAVGVASVSEYFGGLSDVGDRRTWVIARPATDKHMLPERQVLTGDPEAANAAVRAGTAVAVSQQIADTQHKSVGDSIKLPTPTGVQSFRLAATLTNLGWGPGAIAMNADAYRRAWETQDPTALEVHLRQGIDPVVGKLSVQAAMRPGRALEVQTASERIRQYDALARGGLERLTLISRLLLAAAALALATATGAAIWQRRDAFAAYRQYGYLPRQIWAAVLLESSLVLATGCGLGAVTGIYGQWLLGRWLSLTTGFPATFSPSLTATLSTFLLVALVALAAVAIPSYRAVREPSEASLQS